MEDRLGFGLFSSSIWVGDGGGVSSIRSTSIEATLPDERGLFGRIEENWTFFFLRGGVSNDWEMEKYVSRGWYLEGGVSIVVFPLKALRTFSFLLDRGSKVGVNGQTLSLLYFVLLLPHLCCLL